MRQLMAVADAKASVARGCVRRPSRPTTKHAKRVAEGLVAFKEQVRRFAPELRQKVKEVNADRKLTEEEKARPWWYGESKDLRKHDGARRAACDLNVFFAKSARRERKEKGYKKKKGCGPPPETHPMYLTEHMVQKKIGVATDVAAAKAAMNESTMLSDAEAVTKGGRRAQMRKLAAESFWKRFLLRHRLEVDEAAPSEHGVATTHGSKEEGSVTVLVLLDDGGEDPEEEEGPSGPPPPDAPPAPPGPGDEGDEREAPPAQGRGSVRTCRKRSGPSPVDASEGKEGESDEEEEAAAEPRVRRATGGKARRTGAKLSTSAASDAEMELLPAMVERRNSIMGKAKLRGTARIEPDLPIGATDLASCPQMRNYQPTDEGREKFNADYKAWHLKATRARVVQRRWASVQEKRTGLVNDWMVRQRRAAVDGEHAAVRSPAGGRAEVQLWGRWLLHGGGQELWNWA